MLVRRATESKLENYKSFISINPRISGWTAFLADIHMQTLSKAHRTDPSQPALQTTAVELILNKAEAESKTVSKQFLGTRVLSPANRVLSNAPYEAFRTGQAIVKESMEAHEEGTPTGRRNALTDLRRLFEVTWKPFRVRVDVAWPE